MVIIRYQEERAIGLDEKQRHFRWLVGVGWDSWNDDSHLKPHANMGVVYQGVFDKETYGVGDMLERTSLNCEWETLF